MQATTLTAINGDLGSANKYHQEEIEETRKQNTSSSRYFLDDPETVYMFFDKGNLLQPFKEKSDGSRSEIELNLQAVEKALSSNLDKKGKNAVAKLQSLEFKKHRARISELGKLLRDHEQGKGGLNSAQVSQMKQEHSSLQAKVASVPEPVIGRDFTLTLEKSYSIAFALASKKEKKIWMDCFQSACQETLEMIIQEYMKSNKKRKIPKKEIEDLTRKTIYGLYVHFTNRDGDPHLHAHGVIYNLLQELEGGRLMGNNFSIMKGPNFQRLIQKVDLHLHSRMNEQLQEKLLNKYKFIAYKIDKEGGKTIKRDLENDDVTADLSGWNIDFDAPSKKKISELSRIANQVNDQVTQEVNEAKNLRDLYLSRADLISDSDLKKQEKELIVAQYRERKKYLETTYSRELKNKIKPAKGSVQGDFESIAKNLNLGKGKSFDGGGVRIFEADFEKLVRKATENKHAFSELDLEIFGLKYGAKLSEVKAAVQRNLKDAKDVSGEKKYILHEGNWYSRENLLMAMKILDTSQELAKSKWSVNIQAIKPNKKKQIYEKLKLNEDQFKAVDLCLNDSQLNIIAGLPGVGKSTVLKVIVDEIKDQAPKTEFFSVSTSGKIVEQLAGDIKNSEAKTLASFVFAIKSGKLNLTKNSVVVVDEAGMVEDQHYHTLFEEAKKAGAKVILVGDDRQLSSVGRGDSFRDIQRLNRSQTVRINKIVRQKNSKLKETVELMAGSGVSDEEYQKLVASNRLVKEVFADLKSKNMVKTFTKSRELLSDVAQSFMNDEASWNEKIVIASSNNEVSKINNKTQDLRFKGTGTPFISLEDSDLSFYVGDRLMVTKQMNHKYLADDPQNPGKKIEKTKKISNGKLCTVRAVRPEKGTVVVEYFTDGIKHLEEINIQEKKDSISLGYASTIFKAQGVSVESVFIALSDNQLLNSAENLNVAISRGKQRCEVFMLAQHEDRIIESHKSDTKAKSDLQNVKQEFFEKERERKILNQNFDIDLDKKYVSPQAKKELEDQKRAYARGVEKMSQRYMVGGHEIEIFTSKGDYFRFLDSRIGEDARKSFVHQFGVIGEINKKLFGSFYTPDGVVSGSFHKADFKMPSPARDHLLGELIKKYQDMELIEGVKVIDSEKLCKNLDALISRPLPEHEKDLEKPLIR
jgi:conjugative relaxase-like TrwC/TraI family protein